MKEDNVFGTVTIQNLKKKKGDRPTNATKAIHKN